MSITVTQAMVLAAGRGSRLRPLTDVIPKPLVEVAGRTLIDRALDRLEEAGVSKLVVNGSYKAAMLEAHVSLRALPDMVFSYEETPLETGGGIARALPHFGDQPFFCVNGDVIWLGGKASALRRLASFWNDDHDALLLLQPRETAMGYDGKGDFYVDPDGRLTRRADKPLAPYVYGGVQLLHPRLFKECPEGAFSLNVLYDRAMAASPARIRGVIHDGAWLHVGDMKGKQQAEAYLSQLPR